MRRNVVYPIAAFIFLAFLSTAFVSCKSKPAAWDPAQGVTLVYDIDTGSSIPPDPDLAKRDAEVIQNRLDPKNTGEIAARAKGSTQVEIWVHFPKACQDAAAELQTAKAALDATSIPWAKVKPAAELKGDQRAKAIDDFIPPADPRNELLKNYLAAQDDYAAASARVADAGKKFGFAAVPDDLRDAKISARQKADDAIAKLAASDADTALLEIILTAADDPSNAVAATHLAAFPAKYPSQKAAIERVIAAHKKLIASMPLGTRTPEEVERVALAKGIIDFRITVSPEELGGPADEQYKAAVNSLRHDGPTRPLTVGGMRARWFEIDPKAGPELTRPTSPGFYVLANRVGVPYVLCYDDPARAMTHAGPVHWTITAGTPGPDPGSSTIALPFHLDPAGGRLMGALTGSNKGRAMAILQDDRVLSAPNINSRIDEYGEITFGATGKTALTEAQDLQHILDAGALPAPLIKPAAPASGASH